MIIGQVYPGRCPGLVLNRPIGAEDYFRRPSRDAEEIGIRVPGTSSLANIRCRFATAGLAVRASLRRLLQKESLADVIILGFSVSEDWGKYGRG